jgi:glycine amidinotransferase
MNILSVDHNTVCVDDTQEPLMRELVKHGITSVPIRFRHAMTLSGGLHCATLDLRRKGELEDYT